MTILRDANFPSFKRHSFPIHQLPGHHTLIPLILVDGLAVVGQLDLPLDGFIGGPAELLCKE